MNTNTIQKIGLTTGILVLFGAFLVNWKIGTGILLMWIVAGLILTHYLSSEQQEESTK